MTAKLWRSAVVAAIFAIHPLRVESVAWVAERKDLLSGFFFVLTIGAYVRYARRPSRGGYALVLLFFVLGLLCKPMLVTVPLVLLLLDYWPLNRVSSPRRLILEKLPLLALAGASAVVTIFAQKTALQSLVSISLSARLGNAIMSILTYIGQMLWPSNLAPIYPFDPGAIVPARVLPSLLCVAGISGFVYWQRKRSYLVTGWLWYLIMLIPVIGVVQVGSQAHADRYTYLPQIGLALAITWSTTDLTERSRQLRPVLVVLAIACFSALAFISHKQAGYWRDSETLWKHTLAATLNNTIAEQNLGQALHENGHSGEAISHLQRALAINSNQASVHSSLGVILLETGRAAESLAHLEKAVALDANDGDAQYNLANTLMGMGRIKDAIGHYQRALERNPLDIEAMNNMAWLLATAPDSETRDGKKAVKLAERADDFTRGQSPRISATLAAAYAETGNFPQALNTAHRALDLATKESNPDLTESIRAHIEKYETGSPFRLAN